MRGKWLLIAGLVVLFALIAAFIKVRGTAPPPKPAPAPVAVQQPKPDDEISLLGRIQAKTVVDIAAPIDGVVERFLADVGEDVFEGELIAKIKNTRLETQEQESEAERVRAQARVADLESAMLAARLEGSRSRADAIRAKAELDRAEKTYQRQQLLYKEGATPRLTYEKSEADYQKLKADTEAFRHLAETSETRVASLTKELETARAIVVAKSQEVDESKADLGAGEVHSPVDGVVISRHGVTGEAVTRHTPDLYQIGVNLSTLDVVFSPEPQMVARFKAGQSALIQIAEAPGAINGTVREVKQGQVFVEFSNPLPVIKPGMTAQVKMKL